VRPDEATGPLKKEYESIEEGRGAVGDVFSIAGLHPGAPGASYALYKELQFGDGPLSRREREIVATVVSRVNGCEYCLAHHADALGRHANEPGLQMLVATDYTRANLSPRERAMADHAVKLTKTPHAITGDDVALLRKHGLTDREVLDVTLLTSYFNLVNRVASGLGLTPQDVRGKYRY
jgi:uncharacterized peroxidase-related enzyme